jgi:response regulator RpfG family c-di-GMP phosphodiesterase
MLGRFARQVGERSHAILHKSSCLNDNEWEFIHNHPILGERILHGAPALRSVARLVRASYERWDGSGCPDRLAAPDAAAHVRTLPGAGTAGVLAK